MGKEKEYMDRPADLKKIGLLIIKRIWIFVAVILISITFTVGVYLIAKAMQYDGQAYIVSSDYYIIFNLDEHPNGVDYYNAYTWDSILRDDPIVDEVMELLPADYTREEVKDSIVGRMLGDYRILTVDCTHKNPERAEMIAQVYGESLALFADKMDIMDAIELWSREECVPVTEDNLIYNAAALGFLIGAVVAVFVVLFWNLLDDGIYVEGDFINRFSIPYLGVLTKKDTDYYRQELRDNLSYHLPKGRYYVVSADTITPENDMIKLREMNPYIKDFMTAEGNALEILRESDGVIVLLPWGKYNGNRCERLIWFLEKQDCRIKGAIITDADNNFLNRYYFGKK